MPEKKTRHSGGTFFKKNEGRQQNASLGNYNSEELLQSFSERVRARGFRIRTGENYLDLSVCLCVRACECVSQCVCVRACLRARL